MDICGILNEVMMKKSYYVFIFSLVLLIVLSWLNYPYWIQFAFNENVLTNDSRALFGDSYGSLNTLFSGLAFAGIITSIFLQSQELRDTRAEIKGQKEEFQLQTVAMNKQVFDTAFFQLLQLNHDIVQAMTIEDGFGSVKKPVNGRDVFRVLYHRFITGDYIYEYEHLYDDKYKLPDSINGHYLKFHRLYGHMVGHYFRNIYQILKYIELSKVEDKKFYSNLLRAQMSEYELALLYYNCLSDLGEKKFKPLVEKYEFFEHLHLLKGLEEIEIKSYSRSAYGSSNNQMLSIFDKETVIDELEES